MTILEYFKLAIRHKYLILIVLVFSLISGSLVASNVQKLQHNNTLFYVIGVQDPAHQSDSFENLQAADQITESIQGWFKDPSFLSAVTQENNLNFHLKGKKQEKNNLLVTYLSDNEENGKIFGDSITRELQTRINNYNNNSDLQIKISNSTLDSSIKSDDLSLFLLISLLIGLLIGYLGAWLYELILGKLKSVDELKYNLNKSPLFSFRNHKQLKTNYHFLTHFLQANFGHDKLQILDLTSKSKIGLEVISKHTGFHDVKSLDLPKDIDKIEISVPTLVLVELGHTNINYLKQLSAFNFTKLETILLDQV